MLYSLETSIPHTVQESELLAQNGFARLPSYNGELKADSFTGSLHNYHAGENLSLQGDTAVEEWYFFKLFGKKFFHEKKRKLDLILEGPSYGAVLSLQKFTEPEALSGQYTGQQYMVPLHRLREELSVGNTVQEVAYYLRTREQTSVFPVHAILENTATNPITRPVLRDLFTPRSVWSR